MVNRVVIVGRLVRDPETRRSQDGKAIANFTVAVDNRNKEKTTSFLAVVCFGLTAEFVSQYIKKGALVGVDGRLQQRNYENQAGQKVNVVEILAESVQSLGTKSESQTSSGASAYQKDETPVNEGVDISDDDLPF